MIDLFSLKQRFTQKVLLCSRYVFHLICKNKMKWSLLRKLYSDEIKLLFLDTFSLCLLYLSIQSKIMQVHVCIVNKQDIFVLCLTV